SYAVFMHYDAPEIRGPGKSNPKQIEDFALEVVCPWPYRGNGINCGTGTVQANLEPNAILLRDRQQMINDLKSRLRRIPVHARNLRQKIVQAHRIVTKQRLRITHISTVP